ncbi:VanW family protein [Trujillonella humicola]|uniref:VanW family protein n=1 Tax=Trujillonella humicola TaxID=3383699 RepID=UPI0039061D2A
MPQQHPSADETARRAEPVPATPEAPTDGPADDQAAGPEDAGDTAPSVPAGAVPDEIERTGTGTPEGTAPAGDPADGPTTGGELSDETRPVPRDRGPVPGDRTPPPPAPASVDESAARPEQAAQASPTPEPETWDQTADIRFAPGQAPGQVAASAPRPTTADDAAAGPPDADASATHHATAPVEPLPASSPDATGVLGPPLDSTATLPAAASGPVAGGPGSPSAPGGGGPAAGGGDDGTSGPRRSWWRRPAVLAPAAAVAVLGGVYVVDVLVAGDDVPRNTVVAGVDIGGLSPEAAARELAQVQERISAEHTLQAGEVTAPFLPADAGVALDVDATVDAASGQPLNPWTRLTSFFSDREIDPVLTGEEAVVARVDALANEVDLVPVDAGIAIDGTTATVTEPVAGSALDREGAVEAITAALATGDPADPIELPVEEVPFAVPAEEAQRVLDEVVTPGLAAPVTVNSSDGSASVEVSVEAIATSLTFTPEEDGRLAVAIDPGRLADAMGEDLTAFGEPAQDARFEVTGGTVQIVPSVDGTGIAPSALATALVDVLPSAAPREVTAELGPVPADLTTEEAQALGIREEISSFTTSTPNSASGTNIRVVAEEVDGALVLPGETFSLNTYTGPRGTAQGYVPANVISGGQLSTAVGGGISQFATTMFNAVFFAGLEDVYHKPHTFYISRYPAGREATVYEGQIDLQWRNDTDTGVFVDTRWVPSAGGGGSITVTFYGTKRYEIEAVEGPRTNYRAPRSLEKPDDGSCISQTGVQGFDVTVTRIFRDLQTGAEIRRETFSTSYAAEDNIRCVPVAQEPDPATPDPGAPPATGPSPAPGPAGRRPVGRRAG